MVIFPLSAKSIFFGAAYIGTAIVMSLPILASAGDNIQNNAQYGYATVLSALPVYGAIERRIPQKQCWIETVRETAPPNPQRNNAAPSLVGSVIGGALGHAVGHGKKNKRIGTAVGAILGASIGTDLGRQRETTQTGQSVRVYDIEQCETRHRVESTRQLIGYDVDYKYQGNLYYKRMKRDPGERIKVSVRVEPLE